MQTGTWKAVLLLLLAATFGGAVGSVVTANVMEHRPGLSGRGSAWYVDLLKHELKLTPAQQDSVRMVLRRHRGEMDSLWATLGPPMEQMRQAIRADIRLMLTPEQQSRFTEVTAQLDKRRRERMKQDSLAR
jgi:Spy/CpxP family protein refolding chaperone